MKRFLAFLLALLLAVVNAVAAFADPLSATESSVAHSLIYGGIQGVDIGVLPWQQKIGPPTLALSPTQHTRPRWVQGNNARQQLTNVLNDLGTTVADYQPGNYVGTLNASAWLNSIGAAPSLAQASGAAQPIILPFDGTKYAWFPGVASNGISTPSTAGNQFSGPLEIITRTAFSALTSAGNATIYDKVPSVATAGFIFAQTLGATGTLTFGAYVSGTFRLCTSSVTLSATGIVAGTYYWWRVTYDTVTGNVNFYYAPDQATPPTSWTAMGTQQTITSGAFTPGTASIGIGVRASNGVNPGANKTSRAILNNGIGGTTVDDFNAYDWPETSANGATAVSSTTGETWTLANTGTKLAQIVGSPQLVGDGAAMFMQMTATIPPPYFVIAVVNPITWTSTDALFDGKTSNSFAAQQVTGTPQVKMYDGTNLTGAINPTLNTYAIITAGQDAAGNATIQRNNGTPATGTLNATALGGFTLFGNGAGTKFGNAQVKEVILLNAIPSSAKLAQIQNLLNQIYHIYAPYASANDWLNEIVPVAANDSTYRLAANGR